MNSTKEENDVVHFGMMMLRAGAMLQSAGACTSRIRIILERIAARYDYQMEMSVSHRSLSLTLLNAAEEPVFNSVKRAAPIGVNFKVLAGISRMSMSQQKEYSSVDEMNRELSRLAALPHYRALTVLFWVSVADAGFCFIAGGNPKAMLLSFAATFTGMFVRQQAHRMHFNPYLCWFFAAFTATLIAGVVRQAFPEHDLELGLATCVLFLVPGVPLINSFVDMIDGNLMNGNIRLINGLLLSFMIALGMVCSMLFFNF